jgi:Flp pilus assembly protein TadG
MSGTEARSDAAVGRKKGRGRGFRLGGQNTVEFAIVAPALLLLFLGAFDLGQAFFRYVELVDAVREGARYATFDQNTDNIKNEVKAHTTIGLVNGDITVTCYSGFTSTTKTCSSLTIGDSVKVSVTKAFQPLTAKIVSIVGSSFNLVASAQRSIQ